MAISVNDAILRMSDLLGNYSSGQVNTDMKVRAIDSAVNYLKNILSFPQDETKYSFLYSSDNFYYPMPSDFQEALGLFYNSPRSNFPQQGLRWDYRPYQELLVRTGTYPSVGNMWSHAPFNGLDQIMMLGTNQQPGQIIETFNNVVWTASGDASGAATDANTFYQSNASEKFNLAYSTGTGTLTSPTVFWNFTQVVKSLGFFNVYVYFPSTNVTSVTFNFQSSAGNSYSMVATTQADGTPWTVNAWNKITFKLSDATVAGTPNLQNINQLSLSFAIPSNFGSVQNFRVDDMFVTYPDLMDFIYMTNIKGKDVSGTPISVLTALTDTLNYTFDFIEPIALYGALYAQPQLRGDPAFMQLYKANFMEVVKAWSRRWPKKRNANNRPRTRLGR
jgi:hypothetical protein